MASSTHIQAAALFDNLKGATGPVPWQIGKLANALLEKAQEEEPDNVALQAIDPFHARSDGRYIELLDAVAVRALIGQIATATRGAPAIA